MVKVDGSEMVVQILGREFLNRGMHGDTVAIQIFPKSEWRQPLSMAVEEEELETDTPVVEETQEELLVKDALDKMMDVDVPVKEVDLKPTGRVVGILKRNWRPYCGTIDKSSVRSTNGPSAAQYVFFWAMDRRTPKIRIRTRQAAQLLGKRIIVAIDAWDKHSRYV